MCQARVQPPPNALVEDPRPLVAGFAVSSIVAIWMTSIASPLIFALALWRGWAGVAVALLVVTAIARLPLLSHWPAAAAAFRWAFARAFSVTSITFEPGAAPNRDRGHSVLYAVHPHGVYTMGFIQLVLQPSMKDVTFFFSAVLYHSPLFHLLSKLVGHDFAPADKAPMLARMRRGADLALTPGGFEEATLTSGGAADRVYIKARAGFVKYCLQHGVAISPVYAFGEKAIYANAQGAWGLRLWLNSLGAPAVCPWGRWCCPLAPRLRPLHVVVGAPIPMEINPRPSAEEVAAAHARYVAALGELFNRHKVAAYGEEGRALSLEVW